MFRAFVSSPLRRLQPEAFLFAALAPLALAACSGGDSPGAPAPASTSTAQGSAGNGSSGMASMGERKCDVTDAVCVESCPLIREGVRCDLADPCPPNYVTSLSCGAMGAPASVCTGILPRDGAFCATACPATVPSTCTNGVPHCESGWKLLSTCAH